MNKLEKATSEELFNDINKHIISYVRNKKWVSVNSLLRYITKSVIEKRKNGEFLDTVLVDLVKELKR